MSGNVLLVFLYGVVDLLSLLLTSHACGEGGEWLHGGARCRWLLTSARSDCHELHRFVSRFVHFHLSKECGVEAQVLSALVAHEQPALSIFRWING